MPVRLEIISRKYGPYWEDYQGYRLANGVMDNPDSVPPWFMAKTARERVGNARVELEQLAQSPLAGRTPPEVSAVWQALRTVEQFIKSAHSLEPEMEAVVSALLGAEVEDFPRSECRWCGDKIMLNHGAWRHRSERFCGLAPDQPGGKHEPWEKL